MGNRSVTLVGGDSLLGQDIKQVFSEQAPDVVVESLDDLGVPILTTEEGQPALLGPVDDPRLMSSAVLILAGSAEGSRRARRIVAKAVEKPAVIDLTQPLDKRAKFTVRAPLVESPDLAAPDRKLYRIAHPTAIVLAEFLSRVHAVAGLAGAVVNALEPASQQGREGIAELQHQTVSLLSFKKLPQEIFDAQLSFNLLPALGEKARASLAAAERQVESDLGMLLAGVPLPSFRIIQAPVFHGLSISAWVELSGKTTVAKLTKSLSSQRIDVRGKGETPPSNAGIAGQNGLSVGRIEADPRNPRAFWIWLVADNHRVVAENAVCLARLLLPVEGRA